MSGDQISGSGELPRPMATPPSIIERAFELARSGQCRSIGDITFHLKREGHAAVDAHLAGPSLRRDLRRLCEASRGPEEPA